MKKNVNVFSTLAVLFAVALVVSNIIANKLWAAPFNLVLPTAVFLFPIVYIIGDVVPEVYGLAKARQMIWLGFAVNAFAVVFFFICLKLPYPVFWEGQSAFETVLGSTPRLLLASFAGYLVGTNANAAVLVLIKKLTGGKYLWMRTIGSTIVGETLDSMLFITIAFFGAMPVNVLIGMVFAQAAFKTIYEALATPLTYAVVAWVKRLEGVE